MTEQRISDLFTAIHAFSQAMAIHAGRLAEDAATIRKHAGKVQALSEIASRLESTSMEFAHGLETLHRIADGAMDDTQTMDLDEVASAED